MAVELVEEETFPKTEGVRKDPEQLDIERFERAVIGLERGDRVVRARRPDIVLVGETGLGRCVIGIVRQVEGTEDETFAEIRRGPVRCGSCR